MVQKPLRQLRQVAIAVEDRRHGQPEHIAAEPDMVDADDIGHTREALDIGPEVGEDRTRWPNADDAAGAGDDPRVIGRDLPALRSRRARHR